MKKIGVVGTGIMGAGIATNYLKNGYQVFIWNRNQERCSALVEEGAILLPTPKDVAEQSDIVFEVTANDESSRAVWLGNEGILTGANASKLLISSATISVAWVDELAEQCESKGYPFFDMPMTGGRIGAETGKLVFLIGGDNQKLAELQDDLKPINEKQIYFGKAGSGIRHKLLLNMLQAIHIVGLGEVLKVASKAGMDIKKVGDALAERPGGTTTTLAWRDYQQTPDPINFSVEWIAKDLAYAKSFAENLSLPLLDDVIAQYQKAIEKGLTQGDWTEVNKV